MTEFRYTAKNEENTDRLGELLANVLQAGAVVALIGTLGAGKTRLVRSIATALGTSSDRVTSPTFVLVNEYREGRLPVYHFDAYRLRDEDEFRELGPEEYFEGEGITFIEWADRVSNCLPCDYFTIEIESLGLTEREFVISANWPAGEAVIQKLQLSSAHSKE